MTWRRRSIGYRNRIQRCVKDASKTMSRLLTLEPLAVSTLPSSFVAVTTIKRGTMNWARMIHLMLPSSMTVVGLKTLKLLAAQPIFMSLMTKTDDIISHLTT
ncbi:hypothetical protein HKD37_11G031043 [Glycine soja]